MIEIISTPSKKIKPTKQHTNKGLTILELVNKAKEGDKLKLVADYAFGMRHDKFKTATLKDEFYIYKKGSLEYNKGVTYMLISSLDNVPYSLICNNDMITGFELIK